MFPTFILLLLLLQTSVPAFADTYQISVTSVTLSQKVAWFGFPVDIASLKFVVSDEILEVRVVLTLMSDFQGGDFKIGAGKGWATVWSPLLKIAAMKSGESIALGYPFEMKETGTYCVKLAFEPIVSRWQDIANITSGGVPLGDNCVLLFNVWDRGQFQIVALTITSILVAAIGVALGYWGKRRRRRRGWR